MPKACRGSTAILKPFVKTRTCGSDIMLPPPAPRLGMGCIWKCFRGGSTNSQGRPCLCLQPSSAGITKSACPLSCLMQGRSRGPSCKRPFRFKWLCSYKSQSPAGFWTGHGSIGELLSCSVGWLWKFWDNRCTEGHGQWSFEAFCLVVSLSHHGLNMSLRTFPTQVS